MSIWDIITKLVTGPLELLLDVMFSFAYEYTRNSALSIVALSLIVNLLILPLYLRADRIQEEEKEQAVRMKPGIDRIKKVFKGDEQYLILQTYYRQNHYKPYYALKSLLPLLLQVPFFMAAYSFLSALPLLRGAAAGPIRDLGAPDALLMIGSWTVNVLPVAMTVINLLSGLVYSKGMPLKSKVQMLVIALVFLVLLYNSPSGLVLYWTLNNVFSLVKNLYFKWKDNRTARRCCAAVACAILAVFLLIRPIRDPQKRGIMIAFAVLLLLPSLAAFLKQITVPALRRLKTGTGRRSGHPKEAKAVFWFSCLFLALLLGILIPSEVLKSSPDEFVDILNFQDPMRYILHSFLLAAGTFFFWSPVLHQLSSARGRYVLALLFAVFALVSVVNFSAFGGGYGNMSSLLEYDEQPLILSGQVLAGLLIIPAVAAVMFLVYRKASGLLAVICIAGCVAVGAVCVMNVQSIRIRIREVRELSEKADEGIPSIHLSKTGKNVVVIMADRAINGFVPYIMNEKPELQEKFDGFTYYPNTLSYGCHTNVGTPPLFGGYEYTPDMLNARADESLTAKQNEALKVMPVMFDEAGYDVTVFDPPFANYSWSSDVSIYEDYPGIHGYIALGKFSGNREAVSEAVDGIRERNLFCYSLFRTATPALQPLLYNGGKYNTNSVRSSAITNTDFLNSYSLLSSLSGITQIEDVCGNGCFFMMTSNLTHNVELLQEPEYVLSAAVDNREYESEHGIRTTADGQTLNIGSAGDIVRKHYQSNMATFLLLADWLDFLRENDVYDNTRIILESDHGHYLGVFGFDLGAKYESLPEGAFRYGDRWTESMAYNPLLMVKDFNAKGFRTDETFMTNADTPSIAAEGVIETPVNPMTGQLLTMDPKMDGDIHLVATNWNISQNRGCVFENQIRITLSNRDMSNPDNWAIEGAIPREEKD